MFNYNFKNPSINNYKSVFENDRFVESLVSILMIDEDKPSKGAKPGSTQRPTEAIEDIDEDEDELRYLDALFSRIGEVMEDTSLQSVKVMTSFYKLRENYFNLNNMQRMSVMKKNPELILQLVELEDQLVENGVLLPSEVYHLSNRKNYKAFDLKALDKSPNEAILKDLLEVEREDVDNAHTKNRLIFRSFMETVGVDMDFTEKCFALTKSLRRSRDRAQDYKWGEILDLNHFSQKEMFAKMRYQLMKMGQYGRAKKLIGAAKVLEYLEVLMGDSIDSSQNYRVRDFEHMFNFEKSTRELLEYNSVSRELNEMEEPYDLVDSDHSKIARLVPEAPASAL